MPRKSSFTGAFRYAAAGERDTDDPLSLAMAPPEGETQEEADVRIRAERAAAKVSDDIDRELRLEVQAARRHKCVKILLLGQSESGKSTVLKNFQRKYDPSAFDRERAVWRSVCQLNVVRSFGIILDVLNHVCESQDRLHQHHHQHRYHRPPPNRINPLTPPLSPLGPADLGDDDDDDDGADGADLDDLADAPDLDTTANADPDADADADATATPNTDTGDPPRPADPDASTPQQQQQQQPRHVPLTPEHRRLIMRLAPLRQIEHALTRRFRASAAGGGGGGAGRYGGGVATPPHSPLSPARSHQELHVSGYAWQRARDMHRHGQGQVQAQPQDQAKRGGRRQAKGRNGGGGGEDEEDEGLCRVLCACREDMIALWGDRVVRDVLQAQRVGVEELSSFFLDHLGRIAVPDFAPTDEDILRARLKTLGVTEHRFTFKSKITDRESFPTADLRIYDVGGSRNQRATWMPFFDDVNAIVFLAPMSAFDQTLIEAPDVNRLEDTFLLWKTICASKLLTKVSFVLLLNKRDVLQRKLEAGIRFGRYVKSYAGSNAWGSVAKYLKSKFKAVQRELSPVPRLFYAHITCATDPTQMSVILVAIEDVVLRRNLEDISLL